MKRRARIEFAVIGLLALIFGLALLPAARFSRREQRDEIRRDAVAAAKIKLEQYFNKHNQYPLEFEVPTYQYVVTQKDATSALGWYVRAELENPHRSTSDFDFDAGRNYRYRVVNQDDKVFYDVCGGEDPCARI